MAFGIPLTNKSTTTATAAAKSLLTMPSYTVGVTSGLFLKSNRATPTGAQGAAFWTAIDLSHTELGWESVSLSASADTTEQAILNITDVGVLTQVVTPELSGAGTMTIRVTADGTETTYVSETLSTGARFCIGMILGYEPTGTATDSPVYGSSKDEGFGISQDRGTLITPIQTLSIGGVGIKFETSLKVTIQGSVNITGTAELLKACANYSLFIPEGL